MSLAYRVEFDNDKSDTADWRLVAVYKTEKEAIDRCKDIKGGMKDFLYSAPLRIVRIETTSVVIYRA